MRRIPCYLIGVSLLALVASEESLASPVDTAARAFVKRAYERVLKVTARRRTSPEARMIRARAALRLGRHAQALRALRRLERQLPHLADFVYFLRGSALMGLERYGPAERAFAKAVLTKGSHWVDAARKARAEALLLARQYRQAARAYELLLDSYEDHPDRPELHLGLARAYARSGDLRRAAAALQWVWLEAPETPEAEVAKKRLDRLQRRRRYVDRPDAEKLLNRARKLRRAKEFDAAIAQYEAVEKRFRRHALEASVGVAYTLIRSGKRNDALRAYQKLWPRAKGTGWESLVRKKLADMLAHAGRLDEALSLYVLPNDDDGELTRSEIQAVKRASGFAARHGQYAKALEIYSVLEPRSGWRGDDVRQRLGWLAYRAGRYDLAIKHFEELESPRHQPFSLYWRARAQERAGRSEAAQKLFDELLEQHLRTYYGQIGRSRLVEAGKVELASVPCEIKAPERKNPAPLANRLAKRYGKLLPGLRRVAALARMGMLEQARREARLVGRDYTWAKYRGRHRAYRWRTRPERLWTGAPVASRRERPWGRRQRQIRAAGERLSHGLARLMRRLDLGYFAWRLGPEDRNDERRTHPRAYQQVVLDAAERFDIDPNLLWAIIRTESAFRPDAISRVGAGGLMQLMPATAARLAKRLDMKDFKWVNAFDPATNVPLGADYLSSLLKKFHGQLPLAAAAYNGGPHNVSRWLDYRGKVSDLDEFVEEIPFRESRRYAKKIVRLVSLYERAHCGKDDLVVAKKLDPTYEPYPNF